MLMIKVSGFILAGGKSSRMSTDKVLLRFDGRTLLESALERMGKVTTSVSIVGARPDLACYAPVIQDIYQNCGPLGGIHAALASSQDEWNLMLAVDMPFVPAELLKKLLASAEESRCLVTVPKTKDGLQPLCAVYRREVAVLAEEALKTGNYRIDRLFAQFKTCIISEKGLQSWGFGGDVFTNLNTPDDLRRAVPVAPERGGA